MLFCREFGEDPETQKRKIQKDVRKYQKNQHGPAHIKPAFSGAPG